jgi:hypothetical protein
MSAYSKVGMCRLVDSSSMAPRRPMIIMACSMMVEREKDTKRPDMATL